VAALLTLYSRTPSAATVNACVAPVTSTLLDQASMWHEAYARRALSEIREHDQCDTGPFRARDPCTRIQDAIPAAAHPEEISHEWGCVT